MFPGHLAAAPRSPSRAIFSELQMLSEKADADECRDEVRQRIGKEQRFQIDAEKIDEDQRHRQQDRNLPQQAQNTGSHGFADGLKVHDHGVVKRQQRQPDDHASEGGHA